MPMPATELLNREFLGLRARLIEIAATLDRIDRAEGAPGDDGRLETIRESLKILAGDGSGPDGARHGGASRAERIQMLFSLPHNDNWQTV